jgi:hypothetical protein
VNKPQAVAFLELIADLYRLANEPDPVAPAAVPVNGQATDQPVEAR